jgi:hypothetical protein
MKSTPAWGCLLYRAAILHGLAGQSDSPMPELTLSPSQGSMNSATGPYPCPIPSWSSPFAWPNLLVLSLALPIIVLPRPAAAAGTFPHLIPPRHVPRPVQAPLPHFKPETESEEKHRVWDPMPELTTTSLSTPIHVPWTTLCQRRSTLSPSQGLQDLASGNMTCLLLGVGNEINYKCHQLKWHWPPGLIIFATYYGGLVKNSIYSFYSGAFKTINLSL